MDVEGLILDVTPADGEFDRDFLEKLGHPVLVCHGPETGHLCSILGGGCAMVDSAHGVVFQLDLERPQHRAILKRSREVLAEDVPVVAVVQKGQKARFRELLPGVETWETEPTVSELDGFAAEVEAADWTRQLADKRAGWNGGSSSIRAPPSVAFARSSRLLCRMRRQLGQERFEELCCVLITHGVEELERQIRAGSVVEGELEVLK